MKKYKIEFKKSAQKEFYKIPKKLQQSTLEALDLLAKNPFSELLKIKKLHALENFYRLRLGNYRLVYEIQKNKLIILVIAIGPRQGIYQKIQKIA